MQQRRSHRIPAHACIISPSTRPREGKHHQRRPPAQTALTITNAAFSARWRCVPDMGRSRYVRGSLQTKRQRGLTGPRKDAESSARLFLKLQPPARVAEATRRECPTDPSDTHNWPREATKEMQLPRTIRHNTGSNFPRHRE
ncbi:hypothetical protein MRX96_015095 [Rhipicephalus microplus]